MTPVNHAYRLAWQGYIQLISFLILLNPLRGTAQQARIVCSSPSPKSTNSIKYLQWEGLSATSITSVSWLLSHQKYFQAMHA